MKNLTIYCVVVSYNGIQWINKCISSLVKSIIPIKILVIDNGSSDGTQQLITQQFAQVIFIQSETNLGFGQANNIGIKKALAEGADYVFLLNQDAWINEDTINKLVAVHLENPPFGILSPIHLNSEKNKIEKYFLNYISPPYCENFLPDLYFNKLKEIYEVAYVNAAAWLIPRNCFEKVGLFDPVFFHYGEDNNLCQRVIYHKLNIGFCPSATIVHDREGRYEPQNILTEQKYRRRKILEELTDINQPSFNKLFAKRMMNLNLLIMYLSVQFKFKRAKAYLQDLQYFLGKKKEIKESRIRNIHSDYHLE